MHTDGRNDTRTTLLGRVRNWEDQESWHRFFQFYRPLIRGFSLKSGLSQDEADEVVQDTLVEVADRLKNREYDREKGSFRGWLFRLTKWRIANQFLKRQNQVVSLSCAEMNHGSGSVRSELLMEDASQSWEEEWQQTRLDYAMQRLRKRMKPKHFQVLHAFVCHGWSPALVAKTLGMSRGQVYLLKLRGLVLLKKEVALLKKGPI